MKIDSRLKIISVSCHSGYKVNEYPINFDIHGKRLEVEKIIDRWYGIGHSYFKVLADDHKVYIIKNDQFSDLWTLEKIFVDK